MPDSYQIASDERIKSASIRKVVQYESDAVDNSVLLSHAIERKREALSHICCMYTIVMSVIR